MEFVRQYIDGSRLSSILTLPEPLRNRRLEIIILPAEEKQIESTQKKSIPDVNTIVDSLIGAIPDDNMSLQDYREER